MRRKHNNIDEEVTLFVGLAKLIVLNNNQQTAYATRNIALTQRQIYIYKHPLFALPLNHSGVFSENSNTKDKNPPPVQGLSPPEHQYKITPNLRPKLVLYDRDPAVDRYLNQLKLKLTINEKNNIVALLNLTQQVFHCFLFTQETLAIDFYEALNVAISTQIYIAAANSKQIPFNYMVSNTLADSWNGSCLIDPMHFLDQKESLQIELLLQQLQLLTKESHYNFRTGLFEITLKFEIRDETSLNHAAKFLSCLKDKIQRITLRACKLSNKTASQLVSLSPYLLTKNLKQLQDLNLSKNHLTDDIFLTLSNILQHSPKLHLFNLSENSIILDNEPALLTFLTSITNYKINLNLQKNLIRNAKYIIKYILNSDNNLSILHLNLAHNPFSPEDLNAMAKCYLQNRKQQNTDLKLQLNQLQLEQPYAFDFLAQQYWIQRQKTMSIPIALTHRNRQITSLKEQQTLQSLYKDQDMRIQTIENLYQDYGTQILKGNFYEMKKIRDKLASMSIPQQDLNKKVTHCHSYRQRQENMIISKFQTCLNFSTESAHIIQDLNDVLTYARIKGLTGPALNCAAVIKHRVEQLIQEWTSTHQLRRLYNQTLYSQHNRYSIIYSQKHQHPILDIDYNKAAALTDQQLNNILKDSANTLNPDQYIAYHYLLLHQKPKQIERCMLQTCLTDPHLSSAKVLRFQKLTFIQFEQTIRIQKPKPVNIPQIAKQPNWRLQTYNFSKQFSESEAVSASAYPSMLSPHQPDFDSTPLISNFIQISNNLLAFLYHTPQHLSDESLTYIIYITETLMNLNNPNGTPLRTLLTEELLIHFLTYFNSDKHRPLQKGLAGLLFQFLTKRVCFDQQILNRLAFYLVKTDSLPPLGLRLHVSRDDWGQTKVNWTIREVPQLREIIIRAGDFEIQIADILYPDLFLTLTVNELDTIEEIWQQVQQTPSKICKLTTIQQNNLTLYWLCGKSKNPSAYLKLLPSYEHIGKIIFNDQLQKKLYLRRVVSPSQIHSLDHLSKLSHQQLIEVYAQAKQSFKETALFLSPQTDHEFIPKVIALEIWIESLLKEAKLVAENKSINKQQREKILSEGIAKLYEKYVPLGVTLQQASLQKLTTQIHQKQQTVLQKDISKQLRLQILNYIQTLGTLAYSIAVPNQTDTNLLLINNHDLVFVDRSTPKPHVLRCKFKNLLWFQLAGGTDAHMNLEIIESIQNGQINRVAFSIYEDHLWLAQCFAIITQTCQTRLSYPPPILFHNEDSPKGLCNLPYNSGDVAKTQLLLSNLKKYFKFTLPRKFVQDKKTNQNTATAKQQQTAIQNNTEPLNKHEQQNPTKKIKPITPDLQKQSQPQPQHSDKNTQPLPSSTPQNNLQPPSTLQSARPEKEIPLSGIIGADKPEEEVVVRRRSTIKRQNRHSRNR